MKKFVLAVLMVLLTAMPAMAKTVFDFINPVYTQDQFKKLSTDIGLALSYVPLAPAEPLGGGVLPHFDLGVEATMINIDRTETYWSQAASDLPSALVFPKLHAQLGLPAIPIDLGVMYARVPDSDIKLVGGEIKWAILKGSTLTPALAIRGAYTKLSGVDVLDVDTKSLDISISKGFAMLTPYAGIGEVWITSKENDTTVNLGKEDITETKSFVGLKLSLLPVFNIVVEADFATVNMYSARLNLHF
jgi:hypothetical protein